MTSLTSWLLLVIVGPVLLLAPGYLALSITRARGWMGVDTSSLYETLGLSAALSLSAIVLVGFALSQTVGLSRQTLLVTHLVLLGGLALGATQAGADQARADEAPTEPGPSPASPTSAVVIGVALVVVALGAGLYDGTDPYTEAHYANASEVDPIAHAAPEQPIAWTLTVENHEQRTVTYTLETRLFPQNATNTSREDGWLVHEDQLRLADGEQAQVDVSFSAPSCCLWTARTYVDLDHREEPLTMHRWVEVHTG